MTRRQRLSLILVLLLSVVALIVPGPAAAAPTPAPTESCGWIGAGHAQRWRCVPIAPPPGACKEGYQEKCDTNIKTEGIYTVDFDSEGAQYHYEVCLKSTTSIKLKNAKNGDRACSGRMDGITAGVAGDRNKTFFLSVPWTEGDSVYVDFEQFLDPAPGKTSRTVNDIDLAGAHNCDFNGLLANGKFWCDWDKTKQGQLSYTRPPLKAYTVNTADPNAPVVQLINLLAWMVSAAAVAGLIIVAIGMGLRLRRGVAGEKSSEMIRPIALICGACLMAATAGPIVEYFGFDQGSNPSISSTTTPTP